MNRWSGPESCSQGRWEKERKGEKKKNRQLRAVMDSDTLALLKNECKGIESLQGSGSKGRKRKGRKIK